MIDWEEILDRHGPSVWRNAWRLLGNADDADDCLQEVFVSAVALARRQTIRDWPAVLKLLATQRALDRLRLRTRRADALRSLAEERQAGAYAWDPERAAGSDELVERLRWALARLPDQQARVLCLHHLSDMTQRQVGDVLGLRPNTVAVLLHRARNRLRDLLAPAASDECVR